jgi:hypothetical protein
MPANPAAHGGPPLVEILDAMTEAIAARAMPGYQPAGNGRHAEFMGWRPSAMVRELLSLHGETQVPRDPVRLAERAFHTTSDFPALLSAADIERTNGSLRRWLLAPAPPRAGARLMWILIVEDDALVAIVLTDCLDDARHEVVGPANDGG